MSYRSAPTDSARMPSGIPFIIGNEAAERFSFYGMKTILTVFMIQYLHLMDAVPTQALNETKAVEYYHQFSSWVYFTPLFGAILADVFFGKYLTILWLSIVYCLGHTALACMGSVGMSFPWMIAGLGLICIGSGGIKPCVSAHVGDQFGKSNQHLLTRVYNWFYFSINFGSFFSTLLTPWLLEHYGPHWAFGVPGVLMAIATLMFWMGRKRFIHVPPAGVGFFTEVFGGGGLKAIAKILPLFVFNAVFWALFDQTGSSWVLQAQKMNLTIGSVTLLESQIQAVNPVLILAFIPLFTFLVYPALSKVITLSPLRKISVGFFLLAAAFAASTLIQSWIDNGQRPSIAWQLLPYLLLTASEILVSIVSLEFCYTQAPKAMKSWIMALSLVAVFMGNQFTAQVNHYIAIPEPAEQQLKEAIVKLPADWQDSPRNVVLPGYDGETGTDDDLVARTTKGELKSLEIPGNQVFLDAAKRIEGAAANGKFPTPDEGQKIIGNISDQFGNPIRYSLVDSTKFRLLSDGPDRTPSTQWDIGLMVELVREKTIDKDSWLARRKAELGVVDAPSENGFRYTEFSGGQSKLEGASYFRFFTLLALATAVLFIPYAVAYRYRSYLND